MIVPDRQTEAYLNSPASIKKTADLCRSGILKPRDFLRAAALCRDDAAWRRSGAAAAARAAAVGWIFAALTGGVAGWGFLRGPAGGVFCAVLLVVCAFLRRKSVVADFGGALVAGALVFLPDVVFGTNAAPHRQLLLWSALAAAWGVGTTRAAVRLIPVALLNAAVVSCGVRFWLPLSVATPQSFFLIMAGANAALLFLREKLAERAPFLNDRAYRPALFVFTAAFLTAAAARSGTAGIGWAGVSVFAAAAGYAYSRRLPDGTLTALNALFVSVCGLLWIYRLIAARVADPDAASGAFGFAASGVLLALTVVARLKTARAKREAENND